MLSHSLKLDFNSSKFFVEPTNLDAVNKPKVSFFSILFIVCLRLEQHLSWLLVCVCVCLGVGGHWSIADDVTILGLWVVFGVYPTFLAKCLINLKY